MLQRTLRFALAVGLLLVAKVREQPMFDDDKEHSSDEEEGRAHRMLRFARRIMDRKELAEDTKDLLYTVVATSDKAKTEAVKMVAREVRNYLSELKLKEDLLRIATSYSLEVSFSLKPLANHLSDEPTTAGSDNDSDVED